MYYDKFLNKIKYMIHIIFDQSDIDVLNVRFYEDDRYLDFYINEFEEDFEDIYKPEWEDSEIQIIREPPLEETSFIIRGEVCYPLRVSLVIEDKVCSTYIECSEDGDIGQLLEDLMVLRESSLPSESVFSAKEKEKDRYSINWEDFQESYENKEYEEKRWNSVHNLSTRAIKAFVEGERPLIEMDEDWLREIGWKGSLKEVTDAIEYIESIDPKAKKWRSSYHHMRLKKGDPVGTYVNFYDRDAVRRIVNVVNEERTYEEDKEKIETLDEALDFGVFWWKWNVNVEEEVTSVYSKRSLLFFIFDKEGGRYTVKGTQSNRNNSPLHNVSEEYVTEWVLDLIEELELERNEEI